MFFLSYPSILKIIDSVPLLRHKAIVAVNSHSWLTSIELCNIKKTDIDLKEMTICIHKRYIPIYGKIYNIVAEQYAQSDSKYIFSIQYDKPPVPRGIEYLHTCIGENMGLPFRLTPKMLRDSFIIHLIQSKYDKDTIIELAGFRKHGNECRQYSRYLHASKNCRIINI